MTLQYLLDTAYETDSYEEEAEDYLADKGIRLPTMSRIGIYKLAWANGWRPKEINKLMKSKDTQLLEDAYAAITTKNPKHSLITRIQHAIKTGDKAKEALAKEELYDFAKRYNLMKDPEVIEFLPDDTLQGSVNEKVLDEGVKDWLKDKIGKTGDVPYSLAIMGLSVTAALIALGTIDNISEYKQLSNVVRKANYEDYEKLKAAQDNYVYAMKVDRPLALIELNKLIKEYKAKYETDKQ